MSYNITMKKAEVKVLKPREIAEYICRLDATGMAELGDELVRKSIANGLVITIEAAILDDKVKKER